jgi:geranylgeranyl diphosphate synthase type I
MFFKDFLQVSAREIDSELEEFFTNWSKDVEHIYSRLLPFVEILADGCRGGKRIRGALVKLGYEMCLNEARNDIIRAAVAMEVFQTAILCHDDIIDKSVLRRGKPSLYARLGGDHAGISKAICLGDIGYFLAVQIIAKSDFPENVKNRAMEIFSKMMLETAIGELLDVEISTSASQILLDDVVTVYKYKTAHYTITGPLMIGAVMGAAREEQLEAIKLFGQNVGIAFQIMDDINDIFSEKKRLGRDIGGDINEGKQTLLYLYAREHADDEGREILRKYFGNSEIGEAEVGKVREIFEGSGALEYAKDQVKEYAARGREAIAGVSKDSSYRALLFEMTEYFLK